jgi:hypothetical protein
MRLAKHILYRMNFCVKGLGCIWGNPENYSLVTLGLHDLVMFCNVFPQHYNSAFAHQNNTKQHRTEAWSCMFNAVLHCFCLCNIVCFSLGCLVMQPFSGHVWCLIYLHNLHMTYDLLSQICHYICQHVSKDLKEIWCFMLIQKHLQTIIRNYRVTIMLMCSQFSEHVGFYDMCPRVSKTLFIFILTE